MKIARHFFLLTLLATATPCHADTPAFLTDNTVGGGFGVMIKEWRTKGDDLDRMKAMGIHYVRFPMPWATIETSKGHYDWSKFDGIMEAVQARGMKAVIILSGGNKAYTDEVDAPHGNIDHLEKVRTPPTTPEAIDAFAAYITATVQHFGGNNVVWEIWNEPDSDRFWYPKADADAFSHVAEAACQAIRKASPGTPIIGPALAGFPSKWDRMRPGFIEKFLQTSAASCFDAFSIHPYRHGSDAPEGASADYADLRRFIDTHKPSGQKTLPVVDSEWGFSLTNVSADQQAAYVLRARLIDMLNDVPLTIWYEWRDERAGPDSDREAHFGLIDIGNHDKPAITALEQMLPQIQDATLEQRLPTDSDDDYLVQLRRPDGTHILAAWTSHVGRGHAVKIGNDRPRNLNDAPQLIDLGTVPPVIQITIAKADPVKAR